MTYPLRTLPFPYHLDLGAARRTLGALSLPSSTSYALHEGDRGAAAYAVQRALQTVGWTLEADGVFGPATKWAVAGFQQHNGLEADGIFGPASSRKMAGLLIAKQPSTTPPGVIAGLVEGESGNLIAAVNWSVPGGVDCGYCQRRLYSAEYGSLDAIHRAFDSLYQLNLLRQRLVANYSIFLARPAVHSKERAWRLAVLNHNYPSGADTLSRTEQAALGSYWTSPQSWVTGIAAHFPDGAQVRTPLDWCQHYSLGNAAHREPGFMVRKVTDWTP